jgi:ankyrin repeat protein
MLFSGMVDIHAVTDDGSTPLQAAVWYGRLASLHKLLELGTESDLAVVSGY